MTLIYHTPLSAEAQTDLGITPTQPFAMADQVRFSEIDALNHVNNIAYMAWFERLRVRYMQHRGISGYNSADDPRIVIRSGNIHYRQEMLMDEDYVTTCRCHAFRKTSFTLHQQIWSGGTLRATFDSVMVLLKPDASARLPIPEPVRARFRDIDGAKDEG